MWPQASLHFYQMLIQQASKDSQNSRNQDYPYLILSNIPVPDLIQWESSKDITLDMVNSAAKSLEIAGADFLVMPCNTMHLFKEDITKWVSIPFISMIDCIVDTIKQRGIRKIWLLGSSTTMQSSLYTRALNRLWVITIIPDESKHNILSWIIRKCIANWVTSNDVELIELYCNELHEMWAEAIILWCTELPLILKDSPKSLNLIASSEILAKEALIYSQT